jgi:3-oxoacyl-[acyl-carrier protein] reductase
MKKTGEKSDNVLIIGASSSIGRTIAARFRAADRRVISTYASTAPGCPDEAEDTFALDLQQDASIEGVTRSVAGLDGRLDAVIFLAGILPGKNLAGYEFGEIDKVMSINFSGQAKLLQGLLPLLDARSSILMLSSISAQRGSFDPIYAASKGALLSLVKSMAAQLPGGARINAIAPGLIQDSAMYRDMAEERRQHHRGQIPSHQLLNQEDLAEVVFDLCQPHWAHMNGACIDLNGGQYVR